MSELNPSVAQARVELAVDEAFYPRDAVFAAACSFTDRCYVGLSRDAAASIKITLRSKASDSFDGPALAAALVEEVLRQAFRQRSFDDGRDLADRLHHAAFGAPGGAADPSTSDDLGTFDDPLGIALSWEATHKPESAAQDAAEPAAAPGERS